MKLTDMDPSWVGAGGEGISDAQGNPVPARTGIGLAFDCPCGQCGSRLFVQIDPPLDGGPLLPDPAPKWRRTGETFEDLTLTPSIQRRGGCNWHGYLTNGEFKSC